MAYPNRCGGPNGDFTVGDNVIGGEYLRFHASNFAQINNHVINGTAAQGTVCFTGVNTGNTPPTVSAGANYTIPKLTPFTLTATGSDPDLGDQNNLTYTWEQYQTGGTDFFQNGTAASYNDAGDPFNTTRPIFRALPATTNASRTFPSLTYILNNANDPPDKVLEFGRSVWTAEELPRISRTIDFRVTARDTIGGVSDASNVVTVDGTAGPFTVTDIAGTWTGGMPLTVNWDAAGTGAGTTINAANVRISLSTDGGQSFPITLAPNTPNDNSESVTIPNGISTTAARIKVEAVGNVFFDITGANFTITPGGTCPIITDISPKVAAVGSQVEITGSNFTNANAVAFNGVDAPTFTVNSNTSITVTVPSGATGGAITVTKQGCTAVESANFTVCSGTAAENGLDDGTQNFTGGAAQNISYHVNRITPSSYPATLSEVRIYHSSFNGFPVGKAITILSAANPSGGTNIDNTNFRTRAATITARDTFVSYPVEPITITSGDFIIGYSFTNGVVQNPPDPNYYGSPVAVDDANHPMRSYESGNGINFTPSDIYSATPDVYMIRAVAYSGACSTGTCSTTILVDDGTIESNGSPGASGTHYYVNRLTPSSYPATLTGVKINTPFAAGTAINVLSAANSSGNTNINNTNFNSRATTSTAQNGYANYAVDPITINSGDFIIGYSVVRQIGEAAISLDTTPPIQGRSYTGGGTGTILDIDFNVNYPIRAVLSSNNCSVGNCTYTVTPTSQTFPAAGGTGTATVTTQPGCPWTASRNNYWISLTSNFQGAMSETSDNLLSGYSENHAPNFQDLLLGTGDGSATFTVTPNSGNSRTGTITVAGQTFTVTQIAAPTAATVAISGRISTSAGNGLSDAVVSLVDQTGQTRTTRTGSFGYYRFDEIEVGNTVTLSVTSRRYAFTPQVVTVNDLIENLNFVSLE